MQSQHFRPTIPLRLPANVAFHAKGRKWNARLYWLDQPNEGQPFVKCEKQLDVLNPSRAPSVYPRQQATQNGQTAAEAKQEREDKEERKEKKEKEGKTSAEAKEERKERKQKEKESAKEKRKEKEKDPKKETGNERETEKQSKSEHGKKRERRGEKREKVVEIVQIIGVPWDSPASDKQLVGTWHERICRAASAICGKRRSDWSQWCVESTNVPIMPCV